jgi:hypothetical protein
MPAYAIVGSLSQIEIRSYTNEDEINVTSTQFLSLIFNEDVISKYVIAISPNLTSTYANTGRTKHVKNTF